MRMPGGCWDLDHAPCYLKQYLLLHFNPACGMAATFFLVWFPLAVEWEVLEGVGLSGLSLCLSSLEGWRK